MRGKVKLALLTLILMSCSKEDFPEGRKADYLNGLSHDMIVLGDRLDNPYTTENMTKALVSVYPTKAGRLELSTTDLYVRFLPDSEQEYQQLENMGLRLTDHPLDYAILVEGDWYHDPQIPQEEVTWQYAVVPYDFDFPDIRHEIIDECYLSENDPSTKADGIDWEAVEREAYIITGNEAMLSTPETKGSGKVAPSGRITIVDNEYAGGKPIGVAGVRVSCNSFVRFAHAYTDRDGYYSMEKTFSANLRYRLVFRNEKGFSIGFNLILLPASVSTLGKSGPEGINVNVTEQSDEKLFRRCVVNNAAYDYYSRCSLDDLDISLPPGDLRLWIFNSMDASSAVMLHHGAVTDSDMIKSFLGKFASLIKVFLPDITIGAKYSDDYASLYSNVCHELAHASHFSSVGTSYWNNYISYIIESYLKTGGMTYGDGTGTKAGYCEIGETWAYYLESLMYKDRYGGSFPTFGTSYWFYPQIFRYLDERGLAPHDIFAVLDGSVTSRAALRISLMAKYPESRTSIDQIFSRYGE